MKVIDGLSVDEERAAAIFRALGNPARIRIVMELARRERCQTTELVDVLPLAQSTVSQHLKVLKDAGVVRGNVEGDLCYCLEPDALRRIVDFCAALGPGADCCEPAAGVTYMPGAD